MLRNAMARLPATGPARAGLPALALLLLLLCVRPSAAIYQDQAGQYDWLQQHIGRVSKAALGGGPLPTLFAASATASTLAALSPKDGRLLWRKVLAEGDAVEQLVAGSSAVVSLSGGGRQLLAFDADSGAARWAADLSAGADLALLGNQAVTVADGSSIKVRLTAEDSG